MAIKIKHSHDAYCGYGLDYIDAEDFKIKVEEMLKEINRIKTEEDGEWLCPNGIIGQVNEIIHKWLDIGDKDGTK